MELIIILSFLLAISLSCNAYLLLRPKPKKHLSKEAHELLHDLYRGGAIVRMIPMNPENIIEWKG